MTTDEEALRQIDQAWNDAYAASDSNALEGILADTWTAVGANGHVVTKSDLLRLVSTTPWPFRSYAFDERSFRLSSDIAIVTGRLSGTGEMQGQAVHIDQRYLRVYTKGPAGWQAIFTQVTPVAPKEESSSVAPAAPKR